MDQAIGIIEGLEKAMRSDFAWDELIMITEIIKNRVYDSIEELYSFIEHLFVDMLNDFLVQLPNAIFKEINVSHPEDLEERVKFSLKKMCKIEKLEALIQWLFPVGTTITNLMTDHHEARTMNNEGSMPLQSDTDAIDLSSMSRDLGDSTASTSTHQDEIIQINE